MTNQTKQDWLQRAISLFCSEDRRDGDILTHEWIRWALEVPVPRKIEDAEQMQWMLLQRFDAFRDCLLINKKIALQSIRGIGYWIVPPNEQARVAAEEFMKSIHRGMERGVKIIDNTRCDQLNHVEMKLHTDTQIRLIGIKQLMIGKRRDVLKLFSPEKQEAQK